MSGERSLPSEACLHVNDLILMRITVKYESVIKGSWDEKKTSSSWTLPYLQQYLVGLIIKLLICVHSLYRPYTPFKLLKIPNEGNSN